MAETRRGGSKPTLAADFIDRDIVTGFSASQIQLGRSLCVDDFLFTQFREERNRTLYLTVVVRWILC
jgi:hypothetical protein